MFKKINKKAVVIATSIFVIATGVGIGTVMFAGSNAEADADTKLTDKAVTTETVSDKASDETKAVKSEDKQEKKSEDKTGKKDSAKSEEKATKSNNSSSAKSDSKASSGNKDNDNKGNTGNGNKGNTNKPSSTQPSKPSTPSQPSKPPQPAHEHYYVKELSHWENIYENVTEEYEAGYVCLLDGMTLANKCDGDHGRAYHKDTNGAFRYKAIYDTREVQKFVGEEPVYIYKCECGAIK